MRNNEPDDVLYLDRDQLRLISDPLRQRILRLLARREMSGSEVAAALEDAPSNLYYHLDRLREAGLIRLVRTEPRRGATEKYYRAVARAFSASPELLLTLPDDRSADEEMLGTVRGLLEDAFRSFSRGLAAGLLGEGPGSEAPVVSGLSIRATPERIAALRARIVAWLEEACAEEDDEAGVEYEGLVMFFPTESRGPKDEITEGGEA